MENNAFKFLDFTKYFPVFQDGNFTLEHHYTPPHNTPTRPSYDYDHTYYRNAALTVLCCGTAALVIICWRWCRNTNEVKQTATGSNRRNAGTATTEAQTTAQTTTASVTGTYSQTLPAIPLPPPYDPDDYAKSEFDKPPSYSSIYLTADSTQEGIINPHLTIDGMSTADGDPATNTNTNTCIAEPAASVHVVNNINSGRDPGGNTTIHISEPETNVHEVNHINNLHPTPANDTRVDIDEPASTVKVDNFVT